MYNSKLTPRALKNLMLVLVILWIIGAVVLTASAVMGLVNRVPVMQVVLHFVCAAVSVVCAVVNYLRWRRMPAEDPTAHNTLDSGDE